MRDLVSGPIDLAFFVFSFVVFLWIAIDSQRVLKFLFARAKPLSQTVVVSLRMLAGVCTAGLAVILVRHVLGSH
jgi:hypothetical protein